MYVHQMRLIACTTLLALVGCGSDPAQVPSPCGPGDAFLIAIDGEHVRAVCAHSDGTLDTFGEPLPISPEEAADAHLRFDQAATRAVVAGVDALWASDGGEWRAVGPGGDRWRQIAVSDNLDIVAAVSEDRSTVVSFNGDVLFSADRNYWISVSEDGAYFIIEGSCSLNLHHIDGSERELVRHSGCGSVERAWVVRTFASSVVFFEDSRLVYRDLHGGVLAVDDLSRLNPYLRYERHQVVDGAIFELQDRRVASVFPAPIDLDATRVLAIEPDEFAVAARVIDDPEISLLASDGSVVDRYQPEHIGYDFWVNIFGDISATAADQRFSLYRLLLGGGGPVPPEEIAIDLIRHDDSDIELVQRLHQGPGWPPAVYRFTADGSGLWRLQDGALTLIALPTMSETQVGAGYSLVARDFRGWL